MFIPRLYSSWRHEPQTLRQSFLLKGGYYQNRTTSINAKCRKWIGEIPTLQHCFKAQFHELYTEQRNVTLLRIEIPTEPIPQISRLLSDSGNPTSRRDTTCQIHTQDDSLQRLRNQSITESFAHMFTESRIYLNSWMLTSYAILISQRRRLSFPLTKSF